MGNTTEAGSGITSYTLRVSRVASTLPRRQASLRAPLLARNAAGEKFSGGTTPCREGHRRRPNEAPPQEHAIISQQGAHGRFCRPLPTTSSRSWRRCSWQPWETGYASGPAIAGPTRPRRAPLGRLSRGTLRNPGSDGAGLTLRPSPAAGRSSQDLLAAFAPAPLLYSAIPPRAEAGPARRRIAPPNSP